MKRSNRNFVQYNNIIREKRYLLEKRILELDYLGARYSVKEIFEDGHNPYRKLSEAIGEYQKQQNDIGKFRYAVRFKNLLDRLTDFDPEISLDRVNKDWMDRFQAFIRDQDNINSEGTVQKYMRGLRTVLSNEFKNGRYSDQRCVHYKIKTHKTKKERLTWDEFERWQKADLPDKLILYRDFFSFMVLSRGTRVGDALILKNENIKDGKLEFEEMKTGKSKRMVLSDELKVLIDRYQGFSKYNLFPLLKMIQPKDFKTNKRYIKKIEVQTARINKNLKLIAAYVGIQKNITNHVARHTFADFCDQAGLDSRVIQSLLNHSSLNQTETYLRELREDRELDQATEEVFKKMVDLSER